jgi:hypothetical protein
VSAVFGASSFEEAAESFEEAAEEAFADEAADEGCASEDEAAAGSAAEEDCVPEFAAEETALLKEAEELELPPFAAPQPVKVSVKAAASERSSVNAFFRFVIIFYL